MLLTGNKGKQITVVNKTTTEPSVEVRKEAVVAFNWVETGKNKVVLEMTAKQKAAIDAIDLYIGYKNMKVNSATNAGELVKPTFSKISTEKSLVVMNYLISETGGLVLEAGQKVKVVELEVSPKSSGSPELFVDGKTQVVENGSAKVLPFNSQNLIINSSSE